MIRVGIDEVGRGPLAGPVVVCGFVSLEDESELLALFPHRILKDSKKLSEKERTRIASELKRKESSRDIFYILHEKSAEHIDAHGISQSIKDCIAEILKEVVRTLRVNEDDIFLLLDGSLYAPKRFIHQQTIIKGDEKEILIACASIVAKVYRDSYMKEAGKTLPLYGFEKHAGYGTTFHRDAIKTYGPSKEHRLSFLKNILKEG